MSSVKVSLAAAVLSASVAVMARPLNLQGDRSTPGNHIVRHLDHGMDATSQMIAVNCDLRAVVETGDTCSGIIAKQIDAGFIKAGDASPDGMYRDNAAYYNDFSCDNLPANAIVCVVADLTQTGSGGAGASSAGSGTGAAGAGTGTGSAAGASDPALVGPNNPSSGSTGGSTSGNSTVPGTSGNSTAPSGSTGPKVIMSPYCSKNQVIASGDSCQALADSTSLVVSELYNTINLNFPASACTAAAIPAGFVGQKLCIDAPGARHTGVPSRNSTSTSKSASSSSTSSSTSSVSTSSETTPTDTPTTTSTSDTPPPPPETTTTPDPPQPTTPPLSGQNPGWCVTCGQSFQGGSPLDAHNWYRAQYGVGPLYWDGSLAANAQASLDYYLSNNSPRDCGDINHDLSYLWSNSVGENLFTAWASNGFAQDDYGHMVRAINSWMEEASDYYNGGGITGHFTQVIWKGTTNVGCGVRYCGTTIMVGCRYQPAGNSGSNPWA